MAGVLCVDIHRFGDQTSAEQASSRLLLIAALREALSTLQARDWWQVDVQHGVLIVCPASPDHVMYLAQAMLLHPEAPGWCMGLHLGMLQRAPDLEGRPQTVGDGVARARLIASHAAPGQALASPAFVDAVKDVRPGYAGLFAPAAAQAPGDAATTRWAVSASADWLRTLKAELARPTTPSSAAPSAEPPSGPAPWTQAREVISRWFVPVNSLLFSIGLLLSQGYRVGLSERRLLGLGLCLAALALLWLLWSRWRRPPVRQRLGPVAWVGLLYGCLLSLAAFLTQVLSVPAAPPAALPAAVPDVAPAAAAAPASAAAPVAPDVAPPPVPVPVAAPPRAPSRPASQAAAPTSTPTERKAAPPAKPAQVPAAEAASPGAGAPANAKRCSAIVARSALGEPLSPEDKMELLTSCR
jgi:hypothetical protein